jgi:hypothetical protein
MNNNYKTFIFQSDIKSKLTTSYIIDSIANFGIEVMKPLNSPNKELHIIYKIKFYKNKKHFTLLKRTIFTFEELNLFKNLLINLFDYNNEIYKNSIVDKIIIKYKVFNYQKEIEKSPNFKLNSFRIPMTMDLSVWRICLTLILIFSLLEK